MKWSDLPPGQRKGILFAWPVVVVLVFGYLLYGSLGELGDDPQLESIAFIPRKEVKKNLWSLIEQTKNNIAAERQLAEQLSEKQKELDEVGKHIDKLEDRLPSQKQKEMMRLRLQEMVNEVPESVGKVEFVSISISERGSSSGRRGRSEPITTVNYRLNLRTDMNGAIWYIHQIEDSPRFMSVNSIDIRPGALRLNEDNREIERELHSVSLDVVTYVLNDGGA